MTSLPWTISLKDSDGKIFLYEEDCIVEFWEEFEGSELTVQVSSFTNMFGAEFSCDSDCVVKRMIFLAVQDWLENDDKFLSAAYEKIEGDYRVVSCGANDPETRIERV